MADTPVPPVVLIVEDNPINMKLASDLLELNKCKVLKAADGEAALQMLKTEQPHVVLLDIHLPGMDGFEVFKRIKAEPATAGLKIVALTALAMKEEEEKIRAMGFTDYISKPIEVKTFAKRVLAVIG